MNYTQFIFLSCLWEHLLVDCSKDSSQSPAGCRDGASSQSVGIGFSTIILAYSLAHCRTSLVPSVKTRQDGGACHPIEKPIWPHPTRFESVDGARVVTSNYTMFYMRHIPRKTCIKLQMVTKPHVSSITCFKSFYLVFSINTWRQILMRNGLHLYKFLLTMWLRNITKQFLSSNLDNKALLHFYCFLTFIIWVWTRPK